MTSDFHTNTYFKTCLPTHQDGFQNRDKVYCFKFLVFVNEAKASRFTRCGYSLSNFCSVAPSLPPREVTKISDNGTCAVLTWEAPYLSVSDNRTFPAKVSAIFLRSNKSFFLHVLVMTFLGVAGRHIFCNHTFTLQLCVRGQ